MNIWALLIEARNRQFVAYGSYAIAAVIVLVGAFWGIQIVAINADANYLRSDLIAKQKELETSRRDLSRMPSINPQDPIPTGYSTVESFHAHAVTVAHENAVTIEQFTSAQTVAPFITRYGGKDASGAQIDLSGCGQVHVQMTLTGVLARVMQMLQDLASSPFPIELASLDIAPQPPDPKSKEKGKVTARVELDVITRGGS